MATHQTEKGENMTAQKECPAEKSGAKSAPYRTYEFNEYGNRHSVTVSFEMAYHDWLKLENSEPFQRMVDYLVKLQTTDFNKLTERTEQ